MIKKGFVFRALGGPSNEMRGVWFNHLKIMCHLGSSFQRRNKFHKTESFPRSACSYVGTCWFFFYSIVFLQLDL